jgi:hypothetical protein
VSEKAELADKLDAIFDRIEVSCDWRLSSEERQIVAEAANALRVSSPAQEPVTTEPVAWRYRSKKWISLLWRYQTEALVNDDFETPSDWIIEPLYAIPAPPQPGREEIAKIVYDAFDFSPTIGTPHKPEWMPGGNSFMQDRARRAANAILNLIGEPK